jgi:hypothetical protein
VTCKLAQNTLCRKMELDRRRMRGEVEEVCLTRLAQMPVLSRLLDRLADLAADAPKDYFHEQDINSWFQKDKDKKQLGPEQTRIRNRIGRLRRVLDAHNRGAGQYTLTIESCRAKGYRLRFHPKAEPPKPDLPRAYRAFWGPLLSAGDPLVVFSNNEFLQRPDGSLVEVTLPAGAKATGPPVVNLTGSGELTAVSHLERLFARVGVEARLRRALLVENSLLGACNVVYVGSPFTNKHLRTMLATIWGDHPARYSIESSSRFPYVSLVDTSQRRTLKRHTLPPDRAAWVDYALVSRMRKPTGKTDLVLAGTSTAGTQAAAAFVSSAPSLQDLAGVLRADPLACLQFVLEVRVAEGRPVRSRIMRGSIVKHRCR